MSLNRFQGDPAVNIGKNGAEMRFISGQPVMDAGLENTVLISLFTKKNWWGNILFTEDSKKIGSDYEVTCNQPIVALSSINDITDSSQRALKWLKDTKLANKITVNVANPRSDYISTEISIEPPGRDSKKLLLLKNGSNWINQAIDPAHDKFPKVE